MTQNDKNMIAGLPFEAAEKEIGATITGLEVIQSMADSNAARNLANEALDEAIFAERHLKRAKSIITEVELPAEPSLMGLFLELREALHKVQEVVSDEFFCTEEPEALADLDQAKELLQDALKIVERAEARASNTYKGSLQPRIVLTTMAEYFTADATATTLRYCHIPEEYRK